MTVSRVSKPRLAQKARLRWDRQQRKYMLLYLNRGMLLNDSATAILKLCDGTRTVAQIVNLVRKRYPSSSLMQVETHTLGFLARISARGLFN